VKDTACLARQGTFQNGRRRSQDSRRSPGPLRWYSALTRSVGSVLFLCPFLFWHFLKQSQGWLLRFKIVFIPCPGLAKKEKGNADEVRE
jgi:hypothetical protein